MFGDGRMDFTANIRYLDRKANIVGAQSCPCSNEFGGNVLLATAAPTTPTPTERPSGAPAPQVCKKGPSHGGNWVSKLELQSSSIEVNLTNYFSNRYLSAVA